MSCRAQGLQNLEARWFNAKVDELNGAIKNAIAQNASARLHYVDTTDAFLGGEACSPSHQFMNELMVNIDYSFHPTASGQLMLASKLAHAVRRT